ncbi:hypothetical protein [Roseibium salinum]|uniref:Uncharacterized protein n=1 Tax=Roseibium salinum TaxID=1604349 RepID=A0ABT3R052_9HYPH|nr:hypothetical protein [Roseibium sp. DSM 29163]MCX2722608.1 hypothetical protein [Roseibium sp. DSM 29163]MDN3719432.1 hypothetical protein [Roseibium salinum]
MPIVSGNAEINSAVIAGNDKEFAERVRISGWVQGREDPDREPREIDAVLRTNTRADQNLSGDRSGTFATDIRTGGATLRIDQVAYPDLDIRKGDTVVALERPGLPEWEVSSVDPRGRGRMIVNLGDKS